MFNQEFCLKYFFRLGHMLSVITLGGKVIMDYLFPCLQSQQTTGSNVFFGSMGSLLIISGFVNTYILPGKEKLQNKYSFWMGALQIKMITSIIFLTPLFNILVHRISFDFPIKAFQFYFVLSWIMISPFLRFYREFWTENNKKKVYSN